MTDDSTAPVVLRARERGVAWRATGREAVVLDLDASLYFGLNPAAAELWQDLAAGATREQLIDRLRVAGAGERAADDVDRFLDQLGRAGLVGESSAAPGPG